jgi:hypothetical protein
MPNRVGGEQLVTLLGGEGFRDREECPHTARIVLKVPSVGKFDANMQRSIPKMTPDGARPAASPRASRNGTTGTKANRRS